MGIEKKGYKDIAIIINKGIDKMANNTNNNMDNNNINDIYKYMFKTFRLRSWPLKNTDGREVKNWQKLPSKEWKKDDTKTYHLYTHLWRRRSQELLEMQNCGVPCGKVNGIFVLDLDFYTKEGVEDGWCQDKCIFYNKYGGLDEFIKKHNIYAVKTISGGTHLYFKYDPRIKQTQNAVNHMDIRSDGGYVVSPFCKIGDNQYEIINEGEINEAPEDLIEFIVKEVMGKQKQKYKKINRKVKIINPITKEEEEVDQLEVDLDVYNFDFSDYILNNICKKLPDKFYLDREHHVKLATAFKTLKRQDIFNKWSKIRCEASDEYEMWPDVDDNECEAVDKHLDQMWSYIGSHNQLYMVNHILNEAEANGYKNARAMLDYYKYKPVPNNPYIPHEVISHKKLGIDPNGDDFIFFNKYEDKYLLVQSDTGTGKTTEFKNYIIDQQKKARSWETKGKFISIVSRVSLGKEQVRVFRDAGIKCHYHQEISEEIKCGGSFWGMYEGDNIVITIDSLLKLQNWDGFEGYTIYLDEYNSLIEYLICVKLLNKKRLGIYNFLINMMRQADRVICTDADINDISIRYMDIVLNKLKTDDYQPTYKYIVNKHKHNNGIEAKEIFSFNKFIKALDKEDKYMICCDSKTQADIIAFLDKKKHKDYMLITADGVYRSMTDKWTSETPDLDSCDKVIFSPAVVYGLDSVMERPVYCYFKEHTISPCAMVQQLSRCRNIKYLRYLFCNKMWGAYTYHDYKQVEDEIIEQERYGLKTHGKIDDESGEVMDCEDMDYIELRAKYEYRNDCFNTNKYSHFIQIITSRGFKVKAQFSQTSIKGCKEVKEEMVEMIEENFEDNIKKYKEFITPIRADRQKIVTEATNDYIKDLNNTEPDFDDDIIWIRNQQKIKEAKDYDKWDNIDEYFNKNTLQLNDILKIDYDKIGDHKDIFLDPYSVQDHFSVCKYFKNDNNTIKEILDSKEDFMCNKAGMVESKMILLNKLRSWTKCKNNGTDEEDKMDINNTCGLTPDQATSFLKEYKVVMERTKWGKDPDLTDQYECQKLLVKIYKHLFGVGCIKKRKSTKKGKSITYYNVDPTFMEGHDNLYQYRLDYKLRQKLINGGVDDFGNEMCLIDDCD